MRLEGKQEPSEPGGEVLGGAPLDQVGSGVQFCFYLQSPQELLKPGRSEQISVMNPLFVATGQERTVVQEAGRRSRQEVVGRVGAVELEREDGSQQFG